MSLLIRINFIIGYYIVRFQNKRENLLFITHLRKPTHKFENKNSYIYAKKVWKIFRSLIRYNCFEKKKPFFLLLERKNCDKVIQKTCCSLTISNFFSLLFLIVTTNIYYGQAERIFFFLKKKKRKSIYLAIVFFQSFVFLTKIVSFL